MIIRRLNRKKEQKENPSSLLDGQMRRQEQQCIMSVNGSLSN
jgi:hypothetical protein